MADTTEAIKKTLQELQGQEPEPEQKEPAEVAALRQQLAEINEELTTLQKQLASEQAEAEAGRLNTIRARIAAEVGLPVQFEDRLNGETEAELRRDAEALAGLLGIKKAAPPLRRSDPGTAARSAVEQGYSNTLRSFIQITD